MHPRQLRGVATVQLLRSPLELRGVDFPDFICPNRCVVVYHYGFNLHFPNANDVEILFMSLFALHVFLVKCPDLLPIIKNCFFLK